MCPLRFILVFLAAALAGYLAWKSVRSPPPPIPTEASEIEVSVEESKKTTSKMISDGFLVFLDMASGRYLWKVAKGK